MRVSHLQHSDLGIRCKQCGERFPVSRRAMSHPDKLLECKESIAAKHKCVRGPAFQEVRVLRPADASELDLYWKHAIERLNIQPLGSANEAIR